MDDKAGSGEAPSPEQNRPSFGSAVRRHPFMLATRMLIAGVVAALAIGFVVFVTEVQTEEPALAGKADGMIALTGGAERITDAVDLFARGHASRLLITGVNQNITRAEISRLVPKFRDLIDCCVDLGYDALNTTGNAEEARRWVRERGIEKSLIVVTSNYHMPRAMVEMSHALPGHELIPYSVVTLGMRDGRWWKNPKLARIMATEYIKYLVAVARLAVTDASGVPLAHASHPHKRGARWS